MILEDLLKPGLDLVVCGTAAGDRSADLKLYYAGRGNKFYSILSRTVLTPVQLAPGEYRRLLESRIGLTDINKNQRGNDNSLSREHFDVDRFEQKILKYQPKFVCFNGKAAAAAVLYSNPTRTKWVRYGLQDHRIGKTQLFAAPSTSGSANGEWDEAYWFDLAKLVKETHH
jgi:double-stranded uracil-DNA glycosylase